MGVHPDFSGKGFAKTLITEALSMAKKQDLMVARLDMLAGNTSAERLYKGMGFQHIDTIQMYYYDAGWTHFKLYE